MKIKKKTIKLTIITLLAIIVLTYTIAIFNTTGFLQASSIDNLDLKTWEYQGNLIKGAKEFTILGTTETCWMLIHSYGATAEEMRPLAQTLSSKTGDFIFIAQLSGHAQVPSALLDKNLEIWYEETEGKFNTLYSSLCDEINVVGTSLTSAIALKLAQEKEEVKNLYILNPFIEEPYKIQKILPYKTRLNLFSGILNYKKNHGFSKINSPEGQANHISYNNVPYQPIKDSLPFIEDALSNLDKINNPTFIAFSKNDEVAGSHSATKIHDSLSSQNKFLLQYENSNHLLLQDNDVQFVISDMLTVEKRNR